MTTNVSEQSTQSKSTPAVIAGKTAPKKPARKPASKPAPAPELTQSEKRVLVLNRLIQAGAQIAAKWNDPRCSAEEATAILSNRLSYCGTRCEYPEPLIVK